MNLPAAVAQTTVRLQPARDGRLVPYSLLALGSLAGALVTGEAALAALAVPFALALTLGLRRLGPVEVTARVTLDSDQVVEGDAIHGRLELHWDGTFDAEVRVRRFHGVTPDDDASVEWSIPDASTSLVLPLQLRAARWGRHMPGEVWVRLEVPFGLLSWTGKVIAGPVIRVLPANERLNRLLDQVESRAVLGIHRSPRIGDGSEFAQLRPYQPGDRLRDLNWAATARHGRPFVNRYHPELSSDVVIAIDAFSDGSTVATEVLARAARAAWALAALHLKGNDRVGLAGLGGRTQWLRPAGGRLARYRLLDTLLRIGGDLAHQLPVRSRGPAWAVPPSALVIVLTPLHDPLTVRAIEGWRARGRAVAVITIDTTEFLPDADSPAATLARRLWQLKLQARREEITGLGIPVVTAPGGGPIGSVVSALRRARAAPWVRRGR